MRATDQVQALYNKITPKLDRADGSDLIALSALLMRFAFEVSQELDARLKEKR